MSPPDHAGLRNVESVAIHPANPDVVYAGTWHLPWKTTDGGRSWRLVNAGMITDSDVFTLTLDRRAPDIVHATACTGIYRSGNGGLAWAKAKGIPASSRRTRSFAQDPDDPAVFYAGTTEGLYLSDDDARTWRRVTSPDLIVNSVAALPRRAGGALLLGTEGAGVLRSVDGGATWESSNEGFAEQLFSRVLFERSSNRLVVGVFGDRHHSGVLQAPRAEGPWARVGPGLEGRAVLAIGLAGNAIFAGTDDGIFRTTVPGAPWRRLPTVVSGADVHPRVADLAPRPNGGLLAATDHGLLRSDDGGDTWTLERLGSASSVLALAVSPNDPRVAVAATPLGTFRSHDGGATWEPVSRALGAPIHSMSILPGNDDVLFAATTSGLLKSTDQGHVWQRRGGGLPLSDVAGFVAHPDGRTLYASDYVHGGLYVSEDAGDSWRLLPSPGLASDRVWALAVDPASPGRLLAASSTGGLHLLVTGPSATLPGASAGAP
jgi:photosystem II stability/assembly factor-like uncharacterized protein